MTTTAVSAESDWCESQGEAVTQASMLIEEEIAAETLRIQAQNGEIFSVGHSSISVREKSEGQQIYWQGYGTGSIEWSV